MNRIVTLRKNEDRRIAAGHLWAFSNEIQSISGNPQSGDTVQLRTAAGAPLGTGLYNPQSLIAVRLISREPDTIPDFAFFHDRIASALALRRTLFPNSETFRLIHGEGDLLPGLIVDKFNEYLVLQIFSSGMERRLTLICDVLESLLHPAGIIERNEALMRTYEGLEQRKGIIRGTAAPVVITEYGIRFAVDLLEGQKTGFFLDQRENRRSVRRYAKDGRVLDCFCNLGGFALNSAYAGSSDVIGIDSAESAVHAATANAALNDLKVSFQCADVFDYLTAAAERKELFDCIILDPPSFAKNRKTVRKAKRGYHELHADAMKVLKPGGILATASCSHHVYEETFLGIVSEAAIEAGRSLRQLEWRGASPDHPVLPQMPETKYLKFGIFQVN